MKLKNYTTSVPVERSIAEIEKYLVMFGASHVMKEYLSDGRVLSLSFKFENNGYKLPINSEGISKIMYKKGSLTQTQQAHCERVAWRLIKDWVHAQLSIIVAGQAKPDEVLLPYLWDGKRTLYESYKKNLVQIGTGGNNEITN